MTMQTKPKPKTNPNQQKRFIASTLANLIDCMTLIEQQDRDVLQTVISLLARKSHQAKSRGNKGRAVLVAALSGALASYTAYVDWPAYESLPPDVETLTETALLDRVEKHRAKRVRWGGEEE